MCLAAEVAKLPTFSKNDGPVIDGAAGAAALAARIAAYFSTSDDLADADSGVWRWLALKSCDGGCSPDVFDVIRLSHWH